MQVVPENSQGVGKMLGWITEKIVDQYQYRQLNRNPVVQLGRRLIQDSVSANNLQQNNLPAQMMEAILKIAASPNPMLANRQVLAEWTQECARFVVLTMDPPPAEDHTGFRGAHGVTGELKAHLSELAKKSEYLKRFLAYFGNFETQDEILEVISARQYQAGAWLKVFQPLRNIFNDTALNKIGSVEDWYVPFVKAMCAWEEHKYREALGLPASLSLPHYKVDAGILALGYSTFMNIVVNGEPDPYKTWREMIDSLRPSWNGIAALGIIGQYLPAGVKSRCTEEPTPVQLARRLVPQPESPYSADFVGKSFGVSGL
jgi:hypothetical protein